MEAKDPLWETFYLAFDISQLRWVGTWIWKDLGIWPTARRCFATRSSMVLSLQPSRPTRDSTYLIGIAGYMARLSLLFRVIIASRLPLSLVNFVGHVIDAAGERRFPALHRGLFVGYDDADFRDFLCVSVPSAVLTRRRWSRLCVDWRIEKRWGSTKQEILENLDSNWWTRRALL